MTSPSPQARRDPRLVEQLRIQLQFLHSSCEAYDRGHVYEAIRVATATRVLLHSTNRSTSLLRHLGAEQVPLLTTTRGLPPGALHGQLTLQLFNGFSAVNRPAPKLGNGATQLPMPAPAWWAQVVCAFGPTTLLSRRDIVLAVANKDGGAHVDTELPPAYEVLTAPGALGTMVYEHEGKRQETPIVGAQHIALRQIGYELLNSPALLQLSRLT